MRVLDALLRDVRELQALLEQRAFGHYIRKGRVPEDISGLCLLLAEMEEYCTKYNPNWETQPRVPSGNPDGGQWTEGPGGGGGGGGGNDGGRTQENEREIYDPPIEPVYVVENALAIIFGGGVVRSAITALNRARIIWRAVRAAKIGELKQTAHGAKRFRERGFTEKEVINAVKSAKELGHVTTKTGKYGTLQRVYRGTNGITVVIEASGRNAGKIITLYRH